MRSDLNLITQSALPQSKVLMRGISLVEVMVSMVLGSLLILAVTQIFLSNSQTGRLDNELARTHDRGRFAFDEFERVMRQIGHSSCSPEPSVGNWVAGQGIVGNLMHVSPVRGWEHSGTELGNASAYRVPGGGSLSNATDAVVPAEFPATTFAGSDLVVVNHIRSQQVTIAAVGGGLGIGASTVCTAGRIQAGNNINVVGAEELDVPQGTVVFFEKNCQGGDIFVSNNAAAAAGFNRGGAWNIAEAAGFCANYNTGDVVTLSTLEPTLFFIGMNDGEPSLFRQVIRSVNPAEPELLVEGVESMQITYGLKASSGMRQVNRYVDASEVTNWNEVGTVRIGLLIRSADGVLDTSEARIFNVNGTQIESPADRRARIVKTATIAIRNRT